MGAAAANLVSLLRAASPRSSQELQSALKVSRATLSRLVLAAGDSIARVGKTRAIRYIATRAVEGVGRTIELFRVNDRGEVSPFAVMHLRFGDGAIVEYATGAISTHPGVPWFLDDARPQGFLGNIFLRTHPDLQLPPLDRWRSEDTLRALALRGEDLWGDVLVGAASVARFQALASNSERFVAESERAKRYPELADRVLSGQLPSSSAGGEQPKFTAMVRDGNDARAVIVKFSPRRDDIGGRRWADLLVCEYIASEVLREHGLTTSECQLIISGDRVFLEVLRFDRAGLTGRQPVITMGPVDAEFIGASTQTWSNVAHELAKQRRLSAEDAERVFRLDAFGRLIFNTDRHLGNISLFWDDGDTFRLAPSYDTLPMLFRPNVQGLKAEVSPPSYDARTVSVWPEMQKVANAYWRRVLASSQISPEFKKECATPAAAAIAER